MKRKQPAKTLLERKLENPAYKKEFEAAYAEFQIEVQLLNAIEKKGLTYEDLAKTLHTKRSNISRDLRQGGISTATFGRIRRMADAVGLTLIPLMIPKGKMTAFLPRLQRLMEA